MLVSNEPLGVILDATVRLLRSQIVRAYCIILLRRPRGHHVGASLDFPASWLAALGLPSAVSFEVWQKVSRYDDAGQNPAWKVFWSALSDDTPAVITIFPIGAPDIPLVTFPLKILKAASA